MLHWNVAANEITAFLNCSYVRGGPEKKYISTSEYYCSTGTFSHRLYISTRWCSISSIQALQQLVYCQIVLRSCWDMISQDLTDSAIDQWSNRITMVLQAQGTHTEHRLKWYWTLTRMWANAQRDGRPAKHRCGTLCSTPQSLADAHYLTAMQ